MAKEQEKQTAVTFDVRRLVGSPVVTKSDAWATSVRVENGMYQVIHSTPVTRILRLVLSEAEKKEIKGKTGGFKTTPGVPCELVLEIPANPGEATEAGFPAEIAGKKYRLAIVQNVGPTSLTRMQAAAYEL